MSDELPDTAWVVALVGLPGMGPVRLRRELAGRTPAEAWEVMRAGHGSASGGLPQRWQMAARAVDPAGVWEAHVDAGIQVLVPGDPRWPDALVDDPEPPPLLLVQGDPIALSNPAVAVIGTRRATSAGRSVAAELGAGLAAVGVSVVSGLAVGIDGAAHRGALDGPGAPVAVVATGLDVVYPRRHRALAAEVAAAGAVVSEYPLGTMPERWRFPARNRVIAGLSQIVVVVESHATGGSMHTVEAALERDRPVMAVPGPVRSPASAGSNGLLVSGAAPARDVGDVLALLGLSHASLARSPRLLAEPPGGDAGVVLEAVGWTPASLDVVAGRCGAPLGPVAVHLATLQADGWLAQREGWYERVR